METQPWQWSQDPINEHNKESSTTIDAEARMKADTSENLSHPGTPNTEVKTPDIEGKDIADELQSKAEIEKSDVAEDDIRGQPLGEVNMEATITADDVQRAGGFGATDDISSFLPVALDSTDFEASLRNARDYEEPEGEVSRPGLGWSETRDTA